MSKINYNCKKCNYDTKNKYDFNKHCKTKKHVKNIDYPKSDSDYPKSDSKMSQNNSLPTCEFCKKQFTFDNNKIRHYKRCKIKKQKDQESKDVIIEKLKKKLEKNEEHFEQRMNDMEKEIFDLMKKMVANNGNGGNCNNNTIKNNNNTSHNMYYVINNFKDAENIEDLLKAPLSKKELDYIHKNGSILGSYNLIKERCITDKEISKRPVHCTDLSRDKYLLRYNNEWIIDLKANKLLSITFDKMKDAYNIESQDIDENFKNINELINLDKNGRKVINKQISKDVFLKNNL
jgi:hypothetical protein